MFLGGPTLSKYLNLDSVWHQRPPPPKKFRNCRCDRARELVPLNCMVLLGDTALPSGPHLHALHLLMKPLLEGPVSLRIASRQIILEILLINQFLLVFSSLGSTCLGGWFYSQLLLVCPSGKAIPLASNLPVLVWVIGLFLGLYWAIFRCLKWLSGHLICGLWSMEEELAGNIYLV